MRLLLALFMILFSVPGLVAGGSREPLSAAEIYQRIGPSLAFVETPIATGSGVLIDGTDGASYVVTNAHVLWPYRYARLTFPDGAEILEAPVAHQDLISDLALLGPIDVDAPRLLLVSAEDLPIGSDVYLIGYPLETELFPTPTIARGILSRIREWPLESVTYFQTDASIAGGQSGGVLATDRGEVIGISGIAVESSYGLAASSADLAPRIESMLMGIDVDRLGVRTLSGSAESRVHTVGLGGIWATAALFAFDPSTAPLSVSARSRQDISLYLLDAYGEEIAMVDEYGSGGSESVRSGVNTELRYVLAEPVDEWAGSVRIESSDPLILIDDPDDRIPLAIGERYTGHLDFPYDYDYFTILLEAGERIDVTVESILIDPYLYIDRIGEEYAIEDDDRAGGMLGLNAGIVFEATKTDEHLIVVTDSSGFLTGGYVLIVESADASSQPIRFEDLE